MRRFYKRHALKVFLSLFIIFLSLMSFSARYYVDVDGNNRNNGSFGSPWLTLAYACSEVTTPGDTIHINEGTFNESSRADLAVGVSIEGSGINATTINSSYVSDNSSDGAIRLNSPVHTNGNQSISYITFTGTDLTATRGICINYRNNVTIHHCKVIDFYASGVFFRGSKQNWDIEPSSYTSGNSLINCIVNSCATRSSDESASVRINGQTGFLMSNNTFTQTDRPSGENGNIVGGEWNKDLKIHNNTFSKPDNEGSAWNFFFELWHWQGGGEIYSNSFRGAATMDIVDVEKSNSEYGVKIYENNYSLDENLPFFAHNPYSITIEGRSHLEYMQIYGNYFKNVPNAIEYNMTVNEGEGYNSFDVNHIEIHHNVLENVGMTDLSNYPIWIEGYGSNSNITVDNFYIFNNSIRSTTSLQALSGIHWDVAGQFSNIFIQNNIITNCKNNPITFNSNLSGATLTNVKISNNLYYENGTNTTGYNMTATNSSESNNIVGNPMFVSSTDLNLLKGSPAINKGDHTDLNINLPYYGSAPDIGAFESRYLDTTLPIVSDFIIPSTSNSLSIPIIISTATDNSRVTGYLLNESPETPSTVAGWTSSFPANYVFSSEGTKTLYAWVKDASGNVSTSKSRVVTISLLKSAKIPITSEEKISSISQDSLRIKAKSLLAGIQEPIKIDIFPNPCQDNVTVSFSSMPGEGNHIEIIDISGRKVASREITNHNERFYLGKQPSGFYVLKTTIGSKEVITKLVINK